MVSQFTLMGDARKGRRPGLHRLKRRNVRISYIKDLRFAKTDGPMRRNGAVSDAYAKFILSTTAL